MLLHLADLKHSLGVLERLMGCDKGQAEIIEREQRQLLVVLAKPKLVLTITKMTNERKEVSANHTSKDPQPAAAGARTLAAPRNTSAGQGSTSVECLEAL